MDRRQFIFSLAGAAGGLLAGPAGRRLTVDQAKADEPGLSANDQPIIDAHTHPHNFCITDLSSVSEGDKYTLAQMTSANVVEACFCAVGDLYFRHNNPNNAASVHDCVLKQLNVVKGWARARKVELILDVNELIAHTTSSPPGAILGVEGCDWLEDNLSRVTEAYDNGVRSMTLMHKRTNELGDYQTGETVNGGLTDFGRQVVQTMNSLGMIIDVTHSDHQTLMDVLETSGKPVIDSHTSLVPVWYPPSEPGRFRNWEEMEAVAAAGGLVCTWPIKITAAPDYTGRETLADWAAEIVAMKEHLGMEHVGLGTDGAGGLPGLVDGYQNAADLPKLRQAMVEAGLSGEDIAAYFGGNFIRFFQAQA
ncbi:MAG: membrane dipeptidase [Deltaproteobacteria bacterium]|nr:membrane dipeptidase [Deltaproteobacteria bacterium]